CAVMAQIVLFGLFVGCSSQTSVIAVGDRIFSEEEMGSVVLTKKLEKITNSEQVPTVQSDASDNYVLMARYIMQSIYQRFLPDHVKSLTALEQQSLSDCQEFFGSYTSLAEL